MGIEIKPRTTTSPLAPAIPKPTTPGGQKPKASVTQPVVGYAQGNTQTAAQRKLLGQGVAPGGLDVVGEPNVDANQRQAGSSALAILPTYTAKEKAAVSKWAGLVVNAQVAGKNSDAAYFQLREAIFPTISRAKPPGKWASQQAIMRMPDIAIIDACNAQITRAKYNIKKLGKNATAIKAQQNKINKLNTIKAKSAKFLNGFT